MRMLFGMIVGVALTVGVAFVVDNAATGPVTTNGSGTTVSEHRSMVNWDVVADKTRKARERLNEAWSGLSHKIAS